MANSPSEPRLGRLGSYRVGVELASGGMATVYLARPVTSARQDRFVALKVAHPHLARDPVFVDMFVDEARLASLIRHPNVCRVLDFNLEGGVPYLVMEYLEGENLASIFGRSAERLEAAPPGELDLEKHASRVIRAMIDACAGLHAAHELRDADGARLDVVHRDVSPENIFLTYDGVVKIVDFGVAQASRQHHRTSTGFVKGKLAYLQPEALDRKPIDRRADVWGVGVTMWELLTGQRLFRRDGDLDTLRAVGELEIRAPSEVRPGLPAALDEVVLRALSRDPDERCATTRELGRSLLGVLASLGQLPDAFDLAEWMDELFPGGREHSRRALEVDESSAAESFELDDPSDLEPTRRRAWLPPLPESPSPWPIAPLPVERRKGLRPTALAAGLGVCVGALGAWYALDIDPSTGADRSALPHAVAKASARERDAVTGRVAQSESPEAIPFSLVRSPLAGSPVEASEGGYTFDIGEDMQEIVLRFRRPAAERPAD